MNNLTKIPLNEILTQNGYIYDRNKDSQSWRVLKHQNGDKVIVSKNKNGDYLYFNPQDDMDRGNIYNFCKNRGMQVKDLLDESKIAEIKEIKVHSIPIENNQFLANKIIKEFKHMSKIGENDKSFLCDKRKISSELLGKFSNLKQDGKYGNAIVPTYTLQKISGGRAEFLKQTGYVSYLAQPITKDKDGKAYDKPLKQLCSGIKGLEVLKADSAGQTRPAEFERVVICESMIDTLSLCEMKGYDLAKTLLCSTNGQISQSQKTAMQELQRLTPNAEFVLGFDNDSKGVEFTSTTEQVLGSGIVSRVMPALKDFNDDLIVGKTLGIEVNKISRESIVKPVEAFKSKVESLYKKYDFLQPYAKNERVKELFSMGSFKFKQVAPKLSSISGTKDCFKRLSLLDRKIEKDFSRAM